MYTVATRTLLAIALTSVLILSGNADVRAAPATCGSEFTAVELAIEAGTFLGRNGERDQDRLLTKVGEASKKVLLDKIDDAIAKLQDVIDTATALASAPKPKLADASGIVDAAEQAIACLP